MNSAYHLTPADWYECQPAGEPYLPESYERDRFVHLTHGRDAVIEVGNRYYRADARQFLVLEIDLERVSAEVRYEDAARRYPHVHGALDRDAIGAVELVRRALDGSFVSFGRTTSDGSLPGEGSEPSE